MNDQTMEKPEGEPTAAPVEPPTAEAEADRREAEFVAAMEAARAEVADLKDRLLRAGAEMENLRRRQQKELADGRQYAITAFASDLLGIGDNLGRALSAVPEEAKAAGGGVVSSLVEGVQMTDREFHRLLEKHGVRKFSPQGEKFDPHRQQAMFEVEDGSVAPGTVVQVVQAGYSIGDRVLRAALVGVSKAPAVKPAGEPVVSSEAAPTAPKEEG
ncbi:MAG: nucleotide exchange factor GrpE [Bauldia sp.]